MPRRLILLCAIAVAAMGIVSCGDDNANNEAETYAPAAHELSQEERDLIITNMNEDLTSLATITQDNLADLSKYFTASALTSMQESINQDLAAGKFRVRTYEDIKGELIDYSPPIAQVTVEFTDGGYYIDANTGAALDQPTNEKKTLALAMKQEDDRWKISGIYTTLGDGSGGTTTGEAANGETSNGS